MAKLIAQNIDYSQLLSLIIINVSFSFPLPTFFFSSGFSLSGGLGEPRQGRRPSVSLPPAAAWLFPANNKVIFAYSSCCPLY